jgi:hypothetical protein
LDFCSGAEVRRWLGRWPRNVRLTDMFVDGLNVGEESIEIRGNYPSFTCHR